MTLVNPLALYLFSLAGLVVLAYFLRRRARPHRVSALFLWQRAEQHGARTPLWARRSLWLLALQLLTLSLLVLALADPAHYSAGVPGRLAIIVDGSASMQVVEEGGTRYEAAVEQALELIDSAADELTLIQAKRHPEVLVPLTQDRNEAKALLRSSQPSFEGEAAPGELLQLLKGQAPLSQFQRIVYITDHPLEEEEKLPLEILPVGGAAENLGLTSFAVRQQPDPSLGRSIFVQAENYTEHEERAVLKVAAGGEEIFAQEVRLPARGGASVAFSHPTTGPTRFTATLEAEDDFPWDNRRYLAMRSRNWKVLWLGEEDRFLRGALLAADNFAIGRGLEAGYDLLIANGTDVPASFRGNLLLINSSYPPLLQRLGPEQLSSPIETAGHPLLAGVEASDILVAKANRVVLPPGGQVLWSADGLPLIYLKQGKDQKICYLGFDLWWSNLPLTVDFPILMKNLLAWLLPPTMGSSLEVGDPLPGEGTVEVTRPEGGSYHPGAEESLIAAHPGFYRVDDGRTVHHLAVNLPPAESQVEGGAEMQGGRALHEGPLGRWPRPLWKYLALGGLLALILELWCYDRAPFRMQGGKS